MVSTDNLDRLREEAQWIKEVFFPLWKSYAEWSFRFADHRSSLGVADTKNKTIEIQRYVLELDPMVLKKLLVHEMCHAVIGVKHGKRWRSRMNKAAQRAERVNLPELATKIRNDASCYPNPRCEDELPHCRRYAQIRQLVMIDPTRPFESIIQELSALSGESAEDFLGCYKRSRKEFDKAQRFRKRFASSEDAAIYALSHPTKSDILGKAEDMMEEVLAMNRDADYEITVTGICDELDLSRERFDKWWPKARRDFGWMQESAQRGALLDTAFPGEGKHGTQP